MEEEHDNNIIVKTTNEVEPETIIATTLGSDYSTSQTQWSLMPQNTLITFHTLPFNLEQIDGSTKIETIDEAGNISTIHNVKFDESMVAHNVITVIDEQVHYPSNAIVTNIVQGTDDTTYTPVVEDALKVEEGIDDVIDDSSKEEETEVCREEYSVPVFSQISATLSATLLDSIPGSRDILLNEVRSEVGTSVKLDTENEYTIAGSISMIVRVYNKLTSMMSSKASRLAFIDKEDASISEKADVINRESKGTSCNLLVPLVSSRGREVHQPIRYSGCIQLGEVDEEEEYRPRVAKRGRKLLRPRRTMRTQNISQPGTDANEVEDDPKSKTSSSIKGVVARKDYKKLYEQRTPFKFFCNICSFKSKRESHMSKHLLLHEKNVRLYPCSRCNFRAIRFSVLRRHEIMHSIQIYDCDQCSYKADNPKLMTRHKTLRHSQSRMFKKIPINCQQCSYKTYNKATFDRHMQMHTADEAIDGGKLLFGCTDCEYKTNRKEHFIRHRTNVHSNNRPFLCDTCGMAFKRPDTLVQHKVTHQNVEERTFAYRCSQCNKGFRSQYHLTEHLTMHSTDRPYLCDHCGAAFKTQSVQKKHIQTIHLNPRSYNCKQCSKVFNTKYSLYRHVRTHNATQNALPAASKEVLQQIEVTDGQTLVQNVVDASQLEETFDQQVDGQTFNNETTTALLYLASNMQLPV